MVAFQRSPFVLASALERFLEAISTALAGYGEGRSVDLSALPSPRGFEDDWPTRPVVFGNPLELPYWTMSSVEEAVALAPIPGIFGMVVLEDETFMIYTHGGWTIACLGPQVENFGVVFCPIDGAGKDGPQVRLHLAKVQIGTRPNESYYHVL